jgi:hypothetical protein
VNRRGPDEREFVGGPGCSKYNAHQRTLSQKREALKWSLTDHSEEQSSSLRRDGRQVGQENARADVTSLCLAMSRANQQRPLSASGLRYSAGCLGSAEAVWCMATGPKVAILHVMSQ